ncbi:MAG: rRNA maturation RNase YbeY [Bacteroidales bacterium]|jgi:rRNA maturation RNase YbeY|nr:rRNA maturation RNase YbeY [Bacteroidales bacterium]
MSSIHFFVEDINFVLKNKRKIQKVLAILSEKEGKELGEISYIFCSDNYLLKINKKYLNADYFTDVITFDYCVGNKISGDIYISIERVKENSKIFSQSFFNETLRVILHGALHLCGYKDKKPKEEKIMREKENFYLNEYSNF